MAIAVSCGIGYFRKRISSWGDETERLSDPMTGNKRIVSYIMQRAYVSLLRSVYSGAPPGQNC